MKLRTKIIASVMGGLVLSGMGVGLMALGGVGPCGPASLAGAIGWWANMGPCGWLLDLVPGMDAFIGRHNCDGVLLILWPALLWSLVLFLILTIGSKFKRHGPKAD